MQNDTIGAAVALLGRMLLGLIFLVEGWIKLSGYSGALAYMQKFGVPGFLLPLAILVELVGAILIIIGWQTRLAAIALAGFTVLAAIIFHANFVEQNQVLHFLKNLAISGGFLGLCANGPGAWSLDHVRMTRKELSRYRAEAL